MNAVGSLAEHQEVEAGPAEGSQDEESTGFQHGSAFPDKVPGILQVFEEFERYGSDNGPPAEIPYLHVLEEPLYRRETYLPAALREIGGRFDRDDAYLLREQCTQFLAEDPVPGTDIGDSTVIAGEAPVLLQDLFHQRRFRPDEPYPPCIFRLPVEMGGPELHRWRVCVIPCEGFCGWAVLVNKCPAFPALLVIESHLPEEEPGLRAPAGRAGDIAERGS